MENESFHYNITNSILILEFDQPKTQNALGLNEIKHILKIIKSHSSISGIIVTNRGRIFCSGGHLKNYAQGKNRSHGINLNRSIRSCLKEFSNIKIPTVAVVQGDCFGGGLEFLSYFDKVFSTPENLFGAWQRKIGLSWGWGGGNRLQSRLSNKKLLDFLLETKTMNAYQCLEIGLIDDIIPKELILEKSMKYLYNLPVSNPHFHSLYKNRFFKLFTEKMEVSFFEKIWWNPFHKSILKKYK